MSARQRAPIFYAPARIPHVDLEAREEHEQQLAQIREKLDNGPVRMQHAEDLRTEQNAR
jgi:arginine utilization protein RocB